MVGEVVGSGGGEHERAVVALVNGGGVGVGVVGGGEVDAGAAFKRSEERRRHVGAQPGRHAVDLLAGARTLVLHG